jgi:hypothetical protein
MTDLPDTVFVSRGHNSYKALHADRDCGAIKGTRVREVDPSLYPNSDACDRCADCGPSPEEMGKEGGEAYGSTLSDRLRQADSLDELREGQA